jgi:hypothetical protein
MTKSINDDSKWPSDSATPCDLRAAVATAAANAQAIEALNQLYVEVDTAVAAMGVACRACGACCNFAVAGHRLYVSTLEMALLVSQRPISAAVQPLRCPYEKLQKCQARHRRALGCRVFFCQGDAAGAQLRLYEQFHGRIKVLHQTFCVPYAYAEATAWLAHLLVFA